MTRSVFQKLKSWLVTEVPNHLAACEFDCRELECQDKDWEACPKRIQKEESIRSAAHNLSRE